MIFPWKVHLQNGLIIITVRNGEKKHSSNKVLNEYSGWQPRYFVLTETGVLSYYKSSELIHEGCKGSCLVLACEVKG